MTIKEQLSKTIKNLELQKKSIIQDTVPTVKFAVNIFELDKLPDFNRSGRQSMRPEYFISKLIKSNFNTVIQHFKSNNQFRKDQTLILIDSISDLIHVYKNKDFENAIKLDNDEQLMEFLAVVKCDSSPNIIASNIIYFGSPGTGKSNKAKEEVGKDEVSKITFHPEYDYNSFVGGYKPTMSEDEKTIKYEFVPQIFTNIYIEAWKNLLSTDDDKHYYLQIEEINRGNCAEIFGDLFQLLDRDTDGYSEYGVSASQELLTYLNKKFITSKEKEAIKNNELRLPSNLSIIATMNTSDQSLFPMDSAFKRRWDWEYVSIDYNCEKSKLFTINITDEYKYNWLEFLENVNKRIVETTQSQDKQIGNWFINAINTSNIIEEKTFINKVLFYLWNDVFKDEENTIFQKFKNGKSDKKGYSPIYYEDFFDDKERIKLIKHIMKEELKVNNLAETNNENSN